jgi:hypothetical protein
VVTNVGGALAAGDSFQLFDAPNATGTFALITLPSLGAGLEWDVSQLNSGLLSVVAAAPPQIATIMQLVDGNFQLAGTGVPGVEYELHATTNLVPPIIWNVVTNSTADGSGAFQLIDPEATNFPRRFYRAVGE